MPDPTHVLLKIDIGGTVADDAWQSLRHYEEMQEAHYGPKYGSSFGPRACPHPLTAMHPAGEWMGAMIVLPTPLLAQYAIRHYLKQPRVLDAEIEE